MGGRRRRWRLVCLVSSLTQPGVTQEHPMVVRIVRLGTPRAADEGLRIGTVRRPPRGVPSPMVCLCSQVPSRDGVTGSQPLHSRPRCPIASNQLLRWMLLRPGGSLSPLSTPSATRGCRREARAGQRRAGASRRAVYPASGTAMTAFEGEPGRFSTSKGTIRFDAGSRRHSLAFAGWSGIASRRTSLDNGRRRAAPGAAADAERPAVQPGGEGE